MIPLQAKEKILLFAFVITIAVAGDYFYPKLKPEPPVVVLPNYFANIFLEAKTAFVYDFEKDKALFTKHEDLPLPIASITKIMTALVALDELKNDDVIVISKIALEEEGDNGLLLEEKWKAGDLIKFMLLVSSNDAAYAVSEMIPDFINKMNMKARELGLSKTHFDSVTGISENNISTAKEVVQLLYHAYNSYPEIFGVTALSEDSFISLSNTEHKNIKNTNPLVTEGHILASKTGMTKIAGGSLVVLLNSDSHIAISALGSSLEGRFVDVSQLSAAALLTK